MRVRQLDNDKSEQTPNVNPCERKALRFESPLTMSVRTDVQTAVFLRDVRHGTLETAKYASHRTVSSGLMESSRIATGSLAGVMGGVALS